MSYRARALVRGRVGRLYICINWVSINLLVALQLIIEQSLYYFLAVIPVIGKTICFYLSILTKLFNKQANI